MLEAGMKAPDFTLEDKDGNLVSLHDFAGKKVVVYFYPKDSTPGCTRQACAFRNNYGEYKNLGVEVIGISIHRSCDNAAASIPRRDLPEFQRPAAPTRRR